MHKLDALLAAYKTDPHQLDPLLFEVTNYARRISSRIDPRVDPDDIAQQVVISIWQKLGSLDDQITGLVVTMTKQRVIDAQRSLAVRRSEEMSEDGSAIRQPAGNPLADRARRIAKQVLGETVTDLLQRGYTIAEIAELTGTPERTLRAQITKVKKLSLALPKLAA